MNQQAKSSMDKLVDALLECAPSIGLSRVTISHLARHAQIEPLQAHSVAGSVRAVIDAYQHSLTAEMIKEIGDTDSILTQDERHDALVTMFMARFDAMEPHRKFWQIFYCNRLDMLRPTAAVLIPSGARAARQALDHTSLGHSHGQASNDEIETDEKHFRCNSAARRVRRQGQSLSLWLAFISVLPTWLSEPEGEERTFALLDSKISKRVSLRKFSVAPSTLLDSAATVSSMAIGVARSGKRIRHCLGLLRGCASRQDGSLS